MVHKRKIHPSWLIAVGSLGIIIGAFLAVFLDFNFWSGNEWLIISLSLATTGLASRTSMSVALLIFAGLGLGLWRGSSVLVNLSGFEHLYNTTVTVEGQVVEDPGLSKDGDLQLRLKNISIDDSLMDGVIWVNVSGRTEIKRSDVVRVEGRITKGFGNIPAAVYRARLVSVQRQDFADVGRDVRDSFSEGIREAIQEPEASLAAGFLAGQKTALPEKLDNELRLLGLTHIVVASGYNLTILVRFARRFFAKVSRFTSLAVAGSLVFGFVQVSGLSPSMSRASLVTGLSLAAWYYGRKLHPFVLLPFAAAITIMINPSYAWGDIGWLLSFTSFIGVIVLSPLIHAYFWSDQKSRMIRQVVVETMSAQLLTLPIIAYTFGQYSPLSLLANLLILPLIPFVMLATFFAGIIGMVFSVAAPFFGLPAETLLVYMTSVVSDLATWPLASREIEFTMPLLVACYIAIFWLIIFLWRKSGHAFRDYNVVE